MAVRGVLLVFRVCSVLRLASMLVSLRIPILIGRDGFHKAHFDILIGFVGAIANAVEVACGFVHGRSGSKSLTCLSSAINAVKVIGDCLDFC
jgi:hypothetical protein